MLTIKDVFLYNSRRVVEDDFPMEKPKYDFARKRVNFTMSDLENDAEDDEYDYE